MAHEPLLSQKRVKEASLSAKSSMSNIVGLFFLCPDQAIFSNKLNCKEWHNCLIFSHYEYSTTFYILR